MGVIVSNYHLSDLDGIEFPKHLKAEDNTTPFSIFTGMVSEEVGFDAINCLVYHFYTLCINIIKLCLPTVQLLNCHLPPCHSVWLRVQQLKRMIRK